jgi:hypothetical protein
MVAREVRSGSGMLDAQLTTACLVIEIDWGILAGFSGYAGKRWPTCYR